MVLTRSGGGAGAAGAPVPGSQRGSQTLELAMVMPAVLFLVVLALHAGLLAMDLVAVQGMAREAARAAAVGGDASARDTLTEAAGARPAELTLAPSTPRTPGTLLTADVRLRSTAFTPFGAAIWLPARAVMRVESP